MILNGYVVLYLPKHCCVCVAGQLVACIVTCCDHSITAIPANRHTVLHLVDLLPIYEWNSTIFTTHSTNTNTTILFLESSTNPVVNNTHIYLISKCSGSVTVWLHCVWWPQYKITYAVTVL